ncbi:hypothetical protein I6N98_08945 [Spongiibacter nanhainus]|uniref:Uncharacterized protein n=1 Tax=Spongiibacter nanhainus TaxID=2794344 RepID=A0A7T4URP4_9GAMM|nr:hypothetical protein [Spongiibacter nanhainus]QQD19941.1 hypothetical protein I6N98_08945 [Spongiibacter nanhainus]
MEVGGFRRTISAIEVLAHPLPFGIVAVGGVDLFGVHTPQAVIGTVDQRPVIALPGIADDIAGVIVVLSTLHTNTAIGAVTR